MATESKELSAEAGDAATGAAVEAAEVISDPTGSTARRVRRLARVGGPVNQRLERQLRRAAARAADTTNQIFDGSLTERLVLRGLHLVKDQARREDVVGLAAYRSLELLYGGFGNAARSLTRFQDASQPPVRPSQRPAARARSRARSQSRTAKPASGAASGAAPATTEARTSARTARSTRSRSTSGRAAGRTAKSA